MKMTHDLGGIYGHRLLEQKSKTISLEDEFREESLPRCKYKYIKCGYVFICLKCISSYLSPFLETGSSGEGRKGIQ